MWGCEPRSLRGQSELLGVVLLFALVLSVSLTVVVVGGDALTDAKSTTSSESADVTFRELQSKAAQSDSEDSSSQRVSFAQSGDGNDAQSAKGNAQLQESDSVSVDPTAGSIRIEVVDDDRGTYDSGFQDLGTITYQKADEMLAYQGGGVFRRAKGSDSSVIVSAPEFEYQYQNGAPTLSMGITRLDSSSDELSGNSFSFKRTGSNRVFPIPDPAASDPVPPLVGPDRVRITVESQYYRAWGKLFDERTNGATTYHDLDGDGEDDAVKLTLKGEPDTNTLDGSAILTGSGEFTNDANIDSYDSGGYEGWVDRENGDVKFQGMASLTSSSNPQLYGELTATGRGFFSNTPEVHGDVVLGQGPGGDIVIRNEVDFHSDFSGQDNVSIESGSHTFGGDIIVGGNMVTFVDSDVAGDVHVAGSISPSTDVTGVTIDGDLVLGGSLDPNIYSSGMTIKEDLSAKQDLTVSQHIDVQGNDISAGDEVIVTGGTHGNDITSANSVVIQSGATINGDIVANGNVQVDGTVYGSVTAGGDITGSGTISGTESDNVSPAPVDSSSLLYQDLESPVDPNVADLNAADGEIDQRKSNLYVDGNHDNAGSPTSAIESGNCGTGCTLQSGNYSLDRIDISTSESLTLDTTNGDIEIYVHEGVTMNGDVNVVGDNQVRVYNNGANGNTYQFVMDNSNAEIHIPEDDANQFWMYMRSGTQIHFVDNTFRGVVYGPASDTASATLLDISTNVDIYGSIVGKPPAPFSADVDLHFDENLAGVDPLNQDEDQKRDNVGYVQIMIREMMVSD